MFVYQHAGNRALPSVEHATPSRARRLSAAPSRAPRSSSVARLFFEAVLGSHPNGASAHRSTTTAVGGGEHGEGEGERGA